MVPSSGLVQHLRILQALACSQPSLLRKPAGIPYALKLELVIPDSVPTTSCVISATELTSYCELHHVCGGGGGPLECPSIGARGLIPGTQSTVSDTGSPCFTELWTHSRHTTSGRQGMGSSTLTSPPPPGIENRSYSEIEKGDSQVPSCFSESQAWTQQRVSPRDFQPEGCS